MLRNIFKSLEGHLEETCRSAALTGDSVDGPGEARQLLRGRCRQKRVWKNFWCGLRRERGVWCGNRECGWLCPAVRGKQILEVTNLDS